jgi:tetratricopeptide (TPR) repeat protein
MAVPAPAALQVRAALCYRTSPMRTPALVMLGIALSVLVGCAGRRGPDAETPQAILFDNLGTHHHAVTTRSPEAQRYFDQGLRLMYGFNHDEATKAFQEAARLDPDCAMAYWGIALALLDNPHNAIPRPNLAPGLAAIQKAKEVGAKTERERDYIDALMLMYADYDKLSHRQRILAFRDALEKLAAKFRTTSKRRSPTRSRSTPRPT